MNTNWTSRLSSKTCLLVAVACMVAPVGCSHFDLKKKAPWFGEKDDDPQTPTRVVAVWKDAVLHRPNEAPQRGFGGRMMFYVGSSDEPVRVEGDVVIYAFDEQGRRQSDTHPDRKYVFTREQFSEHYSKSDVGHSYSIWVPWDEVGGEPKRVSLIVRFTPADGTTIVSEQASSMLPGVGSLADLDSAEPTTRPHDRAGQAEKIRPVAYDEAIDEADQPQDESSGSRSMQTHTIELPPRFGRPTPTSATHVETTASRGPVARRTTTVVTRLPTTSPTQTGQPVASTATETPTVVSRSTRFSPAKPRAQAAAIARPMFDRTPSPLPLAR